MANPGGYTNAPKMQRAITKKWAEAKPIDYDGDGWGDDDYGYQDPNSAPAPDTSDYGWQNSVATQSATNPIPPRNPARTSFDRGDDNRSFSNPAFASPYPTTQRTPFPEPVHDFEQRPSSRGSGHRPPMDLHIQTPGQHNYQQPLYRPDSRGQQYGNFGQAPFSAQEPRNRSASRSSARQGFGDAVRAPFSAQEPPNRPGSRGQSYSDYSDIPLSAPVQYGGRRSQSSNRPTQAEIFGGHGSPLRPGSRSSNAASVQPPRESSLSQTQRAGANTPPVAESRTEPGGSGAATEKQLPFIRPADIYKRMEEEREKERRSQDSARPSLDTVTGVSRDMSKASPSSSAGEHYPFPDSHSLTEENEGSRRIKPTLHTVEERKSEYGFDNLLKNSQPDHPVVTPASETSASTPPDPPSASSMYSADRRDLGLMGRAESYDAQELERPVPPFLQNESRASTQFGLPSLGRMSSFGSDFLGHDEYREEIPPERPPFRSQVSRPSVEERKPPFSASIPNRPEPMQHLSSYGDSSIVSEASAISQDEELDLPVVNEMVPLPTDIDTSDISPMVSRGPTANADPDMSGPAHDTDDLTEDPARASRISTATERPSNIRSDSDPVRDSSPDIRNYRHEAAFPEHEGGPGIVSQENDADTLQAAESAVSSGALERNADNESIDPVKAEAVRLPLPMSPVNEAARNPIPSPSALRSTSEEWQEWQTQKKQFNSRFGLPDSGRSSPSISTPLSQREAPARGTVRDLAEKLESRSGRSTPITPSQEANSPLLPPQIMHRGESFRPAIPGGWQSYNSTALPTPQIETNTPALSQAPWLPSREESTDSIPTATAPRRYPDEYHGPSSQAMAAAAAAGSALLGVFSGSALSSKPSSAPERDDEDEPEPQVERDPSSVTRDFASLEHRSTSPLPPPPISKEGSDVEEGSIASPSTETDVPASTLGYFPAPLRTGRSRQSQAFEKSPVPHVDESLNQPSPDADGDQDEERLRQDIVQRLTPKSSRIEPELEQDLDRDSDVPDSQEHQHQDNEEEWWDKDSVAEAEAAVNHQPQAKEVSEDVPAIPVLSQDLEELTPKRPFIGQRYSWETSQTSPAPSTTANASSTSAIADGSPHSGNVPRQNSGLSGALSPPGSVSTPRTLAESDRMRNAAMPPVPVPKDVTPAQSNLPSSISTPPRGPTAMEASRIPNTASPNDRSFDAGSTTGPLSAVRSEVPPTPIMKDTTPTSPKRILVATSPTDALPENMNFRQIMALGTSHARVQAFEDVKRSYANSDRLLNEWLLAMKTPEHADVFASTNRTSTDPYPESRARPSARRDFTGGSIGGRQMQEDGKRLLAKAGKFSGIAGSTAKGFLARGKEKLRTVSASDKTSLTKDRRTSSGPSILEQEPRPTLPAQTSSSTFLAPPRLQDLNFPQSDDWSLPFESTNDKRANQTVDGHDRLSQPNLLTTSRLPNETSTSPTISAVGSDDKEEGGGTSSRSVSQVTSPTTEKHPILPQASANAGDQPSSIRNSNVGPDASNKEQRLLPEIRPGPIREDSDSTARNARGEYAPPMTQQSTLGLPIDRQRSVVSNISSPSVAHSDDQRQDVARSVSPEVPDATEEKPTVKQDGSVPTVTIDPVPRTEEPNRQSTYSADPRTVLPQTQRDPSSMSRISPSSVAEARQQGGSQVEQRPFSFMGSESLITPSFDRGDTPEQGMKHQPHPSIGDQMNSLQGGKAPVDVGTDEITREDLGAGKRTSKSYSRPFSPGPTGQEHFANRAEELQGYNQAGTTAGESPLPSARRPMAEITEMNRLQQERRPEIKPDVEEGDYRIPGPYVQEYRSPKQTSPAQNIKGYPNQDNFTSHPPMVNQPYGQSDQPPAQPQYQPQRSVQQPGQQQYREPPPVQPTVGQPSPAVQRPVPDADKGRQRSFGNIFKARSKDARPTLNTGNSNLKSDTGSQKGKGLFRRNSRNDSLTSQQSSLHERRDQVGDLPTNLAARPDNRRRSSRDMLRSPTPTDMDQKDGRKKRFSGFGGLFSRSNSADKAPEPNVPQRASTLPLPGAPNNPQAQPPQQMRQSAYGQMTQQPQDQGASYQQGQGRTPQQPFYGQPNQSINRDPIGSHPVSAFPHGPDYRGPTPTNIPVYGPQQPQSQKPGLYGSEQPYGSPSSYPNQGVAVNQKPSYLDQTYQQQGATPPATQAPQGAQRNSYQSGHYEMQKPAQNSAPRPLSTERPQYNNSRHQSQDQLQNSIYGPRTNNNNHYQTQPYPVSGPVQPVNGVMAGSRPQNSMNDVASPRMGSAAPMPGAFPSNDFSAAPPPPRFAPRMGSPSRMPGAFPSNDAPTAPAPSAAAKASIPALDTQVRSGTPTSQKDRHVVDMHHRSRSPRLGRPPSVEETAGATATHDESNNLGLFQNKSMSPVGGVRRPEDQEKPWQIDLPEDDDTSGAVKPVMSREMKKALIERSGNVGPSTSTKTTASNKTGKSGTSPTQPRTVADKMMSPQIPASQQYLKNKDKGNERSVSPMGRRGNNARAPQVTAKNQGFVAELPGSKAEGYESEEEIPMSATAYPGQEWVPMYEGGWED